MNLRLQHLPKTQLSPYDETINHHLNIDLYPYSSCVFLWFDGFSDFDPGIKQSAHVVHVIHVCRFGNLYIFKS